MGKTYDFAFSFAGEDRELVKEIKKGLKGFEIFYDNEYEFELCGKDLYHYLRNLYMEQTKYVVCFLSNHYKRKVWTNLEFSAIKERLMETFFASDFLIPIVLEKNVIFEDIPSFIGFYEHKSIEETISLLKSKYEQSLNEDFYLENINHFSNYLLQEIIHKLNLKQIEAEQNENSLTVFKNFGKRVFYLLAEDFSKLPCLLLYEDTLENPPSAIITWKRNKNIFFSWNVFTNLYQDECEDISLNELIQKIENYLLYSKRYII